MNANIDDIDNISEQLIDRQVSR